MRDLNIILAPVESELEKLKATTKFPTLYDPANYLLGLGGKRIRPLLCLLCSEAVGGRSDAGLKAALAVEIFHNFTLAHDDIMDDAPLRRGNPTLHTKWNVNQAILSGDVMLVIAYDYLIESGDRALDLIRIFNQVAREVCEGQQLDMDFESRDDVQIAEYLEMIRLKTSVLLASSCKLGAVSGGGGSVVSDNLYQFGLNLGMAFQLQDDYLDAFGDQLEVGKQSGGDIIARKKTYLLLRTLEKIDDTRIQNLHGAFDDQDLEPKELVEKVKAMMVETGVPDELKLLSMEYYNKALVALKKSGLNNDAVVTLRDLARLLIERRK